MPDPGRKERKVVTVLFADLVGFTGRAESLDPEDVEAILSPYHARLRSELERFGGTVEKFIGDAVMAVFGAPVAHEDDPERAVRAALAIRDWAVDEGGVEVRIAVNTGEALVSLDVRPEAGEGMVAGDVVNTAARLQAAAPVNGILVGKVTFRATRDVVDYRDAAPVEAKGKADPIAVWEALQARSRVAVEVRQPRAPLVGRHREVDLLRDALARVRDERSAQLVTLIGVPGIGKSRLVHELFQAVESDPELIRWRQGRSLPYGEGVSFWALGEMVKAQAGILDTDTPGTAESKLRAALETYEDAGWLEPHLRPLVGLAGAPATVSDRRDEAFAAWRRFLESLAEERPLVLVFEDLHWADEGLLDFVDHLVDWASGVPILVVCSARPELLDRRPGWGGGKRNATTISLAPLSDDEVSRLIVALLDRAVLPDALRTLLLERAEGNPLYAEEFTRILGEDRAGGVIPETLQGLIAARLDGVGTEDKALLQEASVVGKVFWLGALEAMTEQDRQQLEQRLHALERKEFVRRERRSSVEGDSEYAFVHVLVRDVAYGQIPRAGRADRHAAAASWIHTLGRPDETAEMLAHHYLSALEYTRAAGGDPSSFAVAARVALREAGDRAMTLNAGETAARHYRAALGLWPEEEQDSEWPDLVVRLNRAEVVDIADDEIVIVERARDALRRRGDSESAAELEMELANAFWVRGHGDLAHDHAEEAVRMVADAPTSAAKVDVLGKRARLHMLADENEEAIRIASDALAMAEELAVRESQAYLLNSIGTARVDEGDERGFSELERSVALGLELKSPSHIHRGYNNLAQQCRVAGDLERANAALLEGRRWNLEFGYTDGLLWLAAEEADLAYLRGEWDDAVQRSDEYLAQLAGFAGHYQLSNVRRVRAVLALARRGPSDALAESEVSLAAARRSKDPQAELPSLACHLTVLIAADRRDEAREVADELLGLRDTGGTWPSWYPIVELAWGFVDVGLGDEAAAIRDRAARERSWPRAARAIGRGELSDAAEILSATGARPLEAYTRLRAAEALAAEDRRSEAVAQLQPALAFYRSVGASWYVRQGERLLCAAG
jgi:class 3 adenylate cyclase